MSLDAEIRVVGEIKPDGGSWDERRKYVLGKVYYNLATLISEAKDKSVSTSLAVFKPSQIIDFIVEPDNPEWDSAKLNMLRQNNLFESATDKREEVVKKLPYKFSYHFKDEVGKESTLMIEDWEIGQLYWKCLRNHDGDEAKACADVKKKYYDDFSKTKDLHLFLGTTLQFHRMNAPNPFIIIGVFYPKIVTQMGLFS